MASQHVQKVGVTVLGDRDSEVADPVLNISLFPAVPDWAEKEIDRGGNGQRRKRTEKLSATTQVLLITFGVRDLENGSYLVLKQLLVIQFSQREHAFPNKVPY